MKVFAISTWSPLPLVNGSTLRAFHLLRALAARHDVDLVAFSAPGAPSDDDVAHLRRRVDSKVERLAHAVQAL